MPIVFIATLDAIARSRRGKVPWLVRYALHVPTLMAAVALSLSLQFPFAGLLKASTYQGSDRSAAASAVINMIPRGASVETNLGLITHLTSRFRVFWVGTIGNVTPDFVVFDTTTGDGGDIVAFAEQQHPGSRYRQVFDEQGYLAAERVIADTPPR
jgi:hypothetical protein